MEKAFKVLMYIFIPGVVVSSVAAAATIVVAHHDISSGAAAIWFGSGGLVGLGLGAKRNFE